MPIREKTGRQQAGRFERGHSGNPAGRPLGSRHRATVLAETLFDNEAGALTRTAIRLALEGDITALRLCIDRLIPPRRERPIRFRLPCLKTTADAAIAMDSITAAIAAGELTAGETAELVKVVSAFLETLATTEFERRLTALEEGRGRDAP
jgi:hypothetical protein